MDHRQLVTSGSGPPGISLCYNKPLKFPPVVQDLHPNCLVCSSGEAVKDKSRDDTRFPAEKTETCEETLELNLNVMFLLKKVLELPSGLLQELLTKCGSPWRWIGLCDECQEFVKEAFALEVEMARLRRRFRRIQLEIKEKISENQDKVAEDRLSSEIQFASEATRRFVREHNYTREKNPFVHGDNLAEASATLQTAENESETDIKDEEDYDDGDEEEIPNDEFQVLITSEDEEISVDVLDPLSSPVVKLPEPLTTITRPSIRNVYPSSASLLVKKCNTTTAPASKISPTGGDGGKHLPGILRRKPISLRTYSKNPGGIAVPSSPRKNLEDKPWKPPLIIQKPRISERSVVVNEPKQKNSQDMPVPRPTSLSAFQEVTKSISGRACICPMCPDLGRMFFNQFVHHINFHKRRPNKCTECSVYLGQLNSVEHHWKAVHADKHGVFPKFTEVSLDFGKIWKCEVCKEGFSTDLERTKHETTEHPDFKRPLEPCFKCGVCSKSFDDKGEAHLHRALEHAEIEATSCFHCNERFISRSQEGVDYLDRQRLEVHLKERHKISYKEDKPCDYCGKFFPASPFQPLAAHMTSIHNVPPESCVACDFCEKGFQTPLKLAKHTQGVHHQKVLVCHVCGYCTATDHRLRQHLLVQHSIRPEGGRGLKKCTHEGCNYETISSLCYRNHLQGHVPLAERERQFTCTTCGKSFWIASQLKTHEEIHKNANTKPYQCEICGNSFAVRNYLYIHKRLSHLNRKFPSTNKPKPRKKARTAASNNEVTSNVDSTDGVTEGMSDKAVTPAVVVNEQTDINSSATCGD